MLFRNTTIALIGATAMVMTPALASAQTTGGDTAATAKTPNPKVGGVEMLPTKTIVENASAAPTLSTLVELVKSAGLVDTLSGPGPFTVFAPTNDAFGRLGTAALDSLKTPERHDLLVKVLTYHVVPGNYDAEKLLKMAQDNGGKVELTTVEGEPLTIELTKIQGNDALVLTDVSGNKAYFTQFNVKQSNGVVHIINGVMIPTQKKATDTATDTSTTSDAASDSATDGSTTDSSGN